MSNSAGFVGEGGRKISQGREPAGSKVVSWTKRLSKGIRFKNLIYSFSVEMFLSHLG